MLRTGVSRKFDRVGVQLGVGVRSYEYRLDQQDHVEGTTRRQLEHWIEWTPSMAVTLGLGDTDIQFTTRMTTGTGTPTVRGRNVAISTPANGSDFITAPSGAFDLDRAVVLTHQLWFRVPIR